MSYSSQLGYIVNNVAVNNIEPVGRNEVGASSNALAGVLSGLTNVLTAADSGSTFLVSTAAAVTVTLPQPKPGLVFRFVIQTGGAAALTVSAPSGGQLLTIQQYTAAAPSIGAASNLSMILTDPTVGDYIEVFGASNSKYVARGVAIVQGDLTVA